MRDRTLPGCDEAAPNDPICTPPLPNPPSDRGEQDGGSARVLPYLPSPSLNAAALAGPARSSALYSVAGRIAPELARALRGN
jgi:hypothetical protein